MSKQVFLNYLVNIPTMYHTMYDEIKNLHYVVHFQT